MLSKKLNDPFYWKNKLDRLDSLSEGSTIDRNMLWEKLNSRLQEKPRSSKTVWYWVAAALLPLLIIMLMMTNKAKDVEINILTDKKEAIPGYVPANHLPFQNEPASVSVPMIVEKKQVYTIPVEKSKVSSIDDSVKENESVAIVTFTAAETDLTLNTEADNQDDTTVVLVAAMPAKKKLQVVHINELETFPPQFAEPANYTKNLVNMKPGKSKINNQAVAAQQNTVGFRIKLSSKN